MGKGKQAVTIIDGEDGPTSVFMVGKTTQKKPLKIRIIQWRYRIRSKRAAKRITADPHTLKETAAYAEQKYHMVEIPNTKRQYIEQYASAKEGLILMHKPKLLGDLAKIEPPKVFNEDSAREMYRKIRLRSEIAAGVPDDEMPMDFHVYRIRVGDGRIELAIDFRWEIFEISYSGTRRTMKKVKSVVKDLYLYYGVSGEDIKNRTKRYSSLLATLSD